MSSLYKEDKDVTMKVKRELLDNDEDQSAATAAAAAAENITDDDASEDGQKSNDLCATWSRAGGDVAVNVAAAAECIKKERQTEKILDLSCVADDAGDECADGIRYLYSSASL